MVSSRNPGQSRARAPAVAGMFYPGDSKNLTNQINEFLDAAQVGSYPDDLLGIISPHAGYVYSGPVAAYGYKLLQGKSYDVVVVIAPSHRHAFLGASIYNIGPYITPLGEIPLAEDVISKLMKHPYVDFYPEAHSKEHSLEVQLPFLQVVLGDFQLVPIIMGDLSLSNCESMALALKDALAGKKALLVASSDLSHYHSYDEAVRLDNIVIKHVQAMDIRNLSEDLDLRICEACGGRPIIILMQYARALGVNKGYVFKYLNSGDTSGDTSRGVVGYLSAGFFREQASKKADDNNSDSGSGAETSHKEKQVGVDLGLTDQEKKTLKEIARSAIAARLGLESHRDIPITSDVLKEKRGAFVTLEDHGELRGCIGYIEAYKPLYITIEEMAEAAAFHDYRFSPVEKEEFKYLDIEISVLTPLKLIEDINEIQVGVHGIYIIKGRNKGLLLPQVATDRNWDRITFLEHTCMKAGLSRNDWKEKDAKIYIFSADIF